MKTRNRRLMKGILSLCLIGGLCAAFPQQSVKAHEMYYDGNTPIVLKWVNLSNGKAYMKMNGDKLQSPYSNYYSTVKNAWPNASSRVQVVQASFSASTVDFITPTSDAWSDLVGYWRIGEVSGYCRAQTTDGFIVDNMESAKVSNGKISYASIYVTPHLDVCDTETYRKKTMIHEIGHALGLGHANRGPYATNVASVMNQGKTSYYTPQAHDVNDLIPKY